MFGPAARDAAPALRNEVDVEALVVELEQSTESFQTNGYDFEVLAMGERPGFKPFTNTNRDVLKQLAGMRDERQVLSHLGDNLQLLEGIAHVRAWFFDRHSAASKTGRQEMLATVE